MEVVAESQSNVPGIAKSLGETGEAAHSHLTAAAMSMASGTRVKSAGFARRRMGQMRVASGEGAGGIAVVVVVHCLGNTGGSYSERCRPDTAAAESGTGRCMAEGPS